MSNELPERGPKNELLYRIPKNTPKSRCRRPSCGAEVWWVKTKLNKDMIVDCSLEGTTKVPVREHRRDMPEGRDGIGTPHWPNCKDTDYVRGTRK